jgi:glucose-6-phosphate isomerase
VTPRTTTVASNGILPADQQGLDVRFHESSLGFQYGPGVFGPAPEARRLDDIRKSLRDPNCAGPDPVYNIAMDVGRETDRSELTRRMLLFGVVVYASGRLGEEPVRSQGHVHAISPHSGWSAPEVFEIWHGSAIIYGQERTSSDPGACYAISAQPGDVVVMPPNWAHFVANARTDEQLVFGAWCDRQYGFVYEGVRSRGGLAWFPLYNSRGAISWTENPRYDASALTKRTAREYPELGISSETPIYSQFADDPERFQWVSDPQRCEKLWPEFRP